jgi:hypothetical protein
MDLMNCWMKTIGLILVSALVWACGSKEEPRPEAKPDGPVLINVTKAGIEINDKMAVSLTCEEAGQPCKAGASPGSNATYRVAAAHKKGKRDEAFEIPAIRARMKELADDRKKHVDRTGATAKVEVWLDPDIPFRTIAELVYNLGLAGAGMDTMRFYVLGHKQPGVDVSAPQIATSKKGAGTKRKPITPTVLITKDSLMMRVHPIASFPNWLPVIAHKRGASGLHPDLRTLYQQLIQVSNENTARVGVPGAARVALQLSATMDIRWSTLYQVMRVAHSRLVQERYATDEAFALADLTRTPLFRKTVFVVAE